jgi:hypothetical protein
MKCKTQSAKCSLKNPACSAVHLSETSYTTSHTLSPCPQKSTGRFPAPWTGEPTGMLSVRLYCVLMQFLRRLTPRTASGAWKEASTKQQRMTLSKRMRLGLKGATPCSSALWCTFGHLTRQWWWNGTLASDRDYHSGTELCTGKQAGQGPSNLGNKLGLDSGCSCPCWGSALGKSQAPHRWAFA